MDIKDRITIYSSDRHESYSSMWKQTFSDFWASRELIYTFFIREISSKYRQSVLGYLWIVLPTIMSMLLFAFIKSGKNSPISYTGEQPYIVYLVTSLTTWQFFTTGLTKTTQSLANAQAIISKINFCKESLIFAAFLESTFSFFIRLLLVIPFYLWFGVCPKWTIVFVPILLFFLSLLTVGVGFTTALVNGVIRDVGNAITLVLSFAIVLSPVIYSPPTEWPHSLVNWVNPVSPFITGINDLIFTGQITHPKALCWACGLAFVLFMASWQFFRIAVMRISERV